MANRSIRPTIENLKKYAAEPLTRWLIDVAKNRTTLTYGEAKRRLERDHDFSTIFPPMMGQPAGRLMSLILKANADAPLLNVLLVRQDDGMPGIGAGPFMAKYFGNEKLEEKTLRKEKPDIWRKFFELAARDVYNYPKWEKLYKRVYEHDFREDKYIASIKKRDCGSEKDGLRRGRGGEGSNHKALRLWVKDNPAKLMPKLGGVRAETEVELHSGDRVDAVYYAHGKTVAIEVKSRDSNEEDFHRGIYQCIKYRAVLCVMDAREDAPVEAVLVTETPIPGDLKEMAKRVKVRHIKISPSRR